MTDNELAQLHKELLNVSHTAALRAVYNAGYCAGAATTPSVGMADFSGSASKPSDATIQILKQHASRGVKS